MSFKRSINSVLRVLPDEGRAVRRLYRKVVDAKRHRDVRIRQESGQWTLPATDAVLWVPPGRIERLTNVIRAGHPQNVEDRVFPPDDIVLVEDGDWDIGGASFESIEAFKAVEFRINERGAWQETRYWSECLEKIEAGISLWGCESAADLLRRFEYVDSLISSIKAHGMQSQAEVSVEMDPAGRVTQDIEVNIGRDGQLLFQDGRHRLAIAKVLKVERVPVSVKVRHQEWQKFREFMFTMVRGDGGAAGDGVLYQSPLHPDLADLPAVHVCRDRLDALLRNLRVSEGRLLDIGCNLGYFCHGFDQVGFACTGVEYGPDIAYAARKIAAAEGREISIVNGDVLDPGVHDPLVKNGADVVLALNIFHHFVKSKGDYERLVVFLKKLKVTQMFFEPHRPDEAPMQGAYSNMSPDEFVSFVQHHTGLDKCEFVHAAEDGRRVFSLYR